MENKSQKKILEIEITPSMIGERLDKALSFHSEIGSRTRAEFLIKSELVFINGKSCKSSYRIIGSEKILVELPTEVKKDLSTLNLKLDIFFEDEHLIVINKPPGLVVHPAAGHEDDTLVNALLHHSTDFLMKFSDERPGIVHRLDKDTSGLLVVAKNDLVLSGLSQQFKDRTIHRVYEAITIQAPLADQGRIFSYLARHPIHRKKYASLRDSSKKIIQQSDLVFENAKWAATRYQRLKSLSNGLTLMELKLETGRTHQIRVHLSENLCPILNDPIYGSPQRESKLKSKNWIDFFSDSNRCALHAKELGFVHPVLKENLYFKADWPDHQKLLKLFSEA